MNASRSLLLPRALASRLTLLVLLSCSVLVAASPRIAFADVPGRVGRIAFIQGDVQAYSETEPEWKVAYINQPITSRNSIFVGDTGRAEISVGSTTLAMEAGSQVDIQQLDDDTFDANVVRGRVSMRIRRLDASDAYNVAVPGASFALLRPGRYRIDSLDSTSGITVFEGQASVEAGREPVILQAFSALRVAVDSRDPNAPPQLLTAAPSPVALDDWVVGRENRFRNSQAERYVSPNMTGYEDLDANGRWAQEQDVGPIWYPTTYVQADWAPYRYGRWAYVAPWGYTWIDDAPWGFAPFHYGRWIEVGGRWGWTPGAYVSRPAYAPALVGFYGGSNFSASFSVGSGPAVGWYPLAPWERYSPHYQSNARYVTQVNNITIVNPPPRFAERGGRDWNREHGGTVAPRDAFASQRSISRVAIAAPRSGFDRAPNVGAGDLPRPLLIPGAVRRGPEPGNGNARPDFRSPREFASRPDNAPRGQEQGGRPSGGQIGETTRPGFDRTERNGLPPSYRRLDDRPVAVPAPVPQQPQQLQQQRGANGPGFNRDGRPEAAVQPAPVPRLDPGPNAEPRFRPRAQPQPQQDFGDGSNRLDVVRPPQPQPQDRGFERQNREMRNVQPAPQAPQAPPQAPVERPQRFERPQPVPQPQAQPQPQPQPVERQPRFERPQPVPQAAPAPVPFERPQRIERPAPPAPIAPVAPPAPPAPMAQPRQQAPRPEAPGPRGDGERPGMIRDR